MLTSVLTLAAIVLAVRAVIWLVHHFLGWLGRGPKLPHAERGEALDDGIAVEEGEERTLAARRQWRQLALAHVEAREYYLDHMKLTWYQGTIIFVVGAVAGLVLEEFWMYVTRGLTQSRVGVVWGPFSPLYGFGAVFLTIASYNLRRRHAAWWQVFLISVTVGGALEQFTGWSMEALFKAQSWSYLHLPDHITQWVAWRFLALWGLLGLVWTYLVMPEVLFLIGMPTTQRQAAFITILSVYLTADLLMTVACFQRRTDRDAGLPAANGFERWIDDHYTDEFMSERFQNLVIGEQL